MSKALKKNDIAMIKCLASPPPLVVVELSCTALLLGLPERQAKDWGCIKKMLGDASFLKQLHEIDVTKIPKETAVKARDRLADVTSEKVKNVSQACHSIHQWNQNTIRAVLESAEDSGSK